MASLALQPSASELTRDPVAIVIGSGHVTFDGSSIATSSLYETSALAVKSNEGVSSSVTMSEITSSSVKFRSSGMRGSSISSIAASTASSMSAATELKVPSLVSVPSSTFSFASMKISISASASPTARRRSCTAENFWISTRLKVDSFARETAFIFSEIRFSSLVFVSI